MPEITAKKNRYKPKYCKRLEAEIKKGGPVYGVAFSFTGPVIE